ncbi:hypothetical protein KP509_29G012200 [Ceratopteris richardii]|uniref:Uncharacterized protein n=1 Tax=Ceratopteris richardii TaxID=49495 RepID=A0A8T2R5S5_CERRI|nr:hypothetical protein KP509_29G012200 [Ceratopteris richardii]KAH7291337.1 hypothetical protein KP509_29G012200 [Ceratopteris richardii]KAH7291338.1 hypothetical protein KP509_29G012200 [Ceratopteris richardii]KAH7291339.1 hypothetical protein KP509_29G012200 [Ceratopteris richardii]KAH7291340.1 hypothetical protein KP509_29G012200 [Ceratopteris richardii]
MSDLASSIDEDDNFFDHSYGNGKAQHEVGMTTYVNTTIPKSESKLKRKSSIKQNVDADDMINLLSGSDPLRVELTRLENEVREKERELADAQAEIKALKLTERAREKAYEELSEVLRKVEDKLKQTEILLENKNLENKKINDEKKAALAAQFAAEATLRRVHAAQKDEDMPPIEAILAPLEAELKIARQEVAKLQDDNRALDRLTKSKEAALLEAERTVQIAELKASMVDDLQNRNQELMKQIEMCQEENKIVDKLHRQKVAEVEKLSTTVAELEEAVLAGGAAANAVRERQRQVNQLLEEKRTLERELARTRVSANRVATVVANEWKDGNDKVMPVKQWLDERRFMQGEIKQLRDKLNTAERTAKSEAQLKEKFQLRLKVLEEGLKGAPNGSMVRLPSGGEDGSRIINGPSRRQSIGGTEDPSRAAVNGFNSRRRNSSSQLRGSISSSLLLRNAKSTSKSFDGGRPDATTNRGKPYANGFSVHHKQNSPASTVENGIMKQDVGLKPENEEVSADTVSGVLYDMLQKEVIALRKASHEKDQSLKDKDDAIEMLDKKVETLKTAMDVEAKKFRREITNMERRLTALQVDGRHQGISRVHLGTSQSLSASGRSSRNT